MTSIFLQRISEKQASTTFTGASILFRHRRAGLDSFRHLMHLRNSLHENPGLWGRSGVVCVSLGSRSGVVSGRLGVFRESFGSFGDRSGVVRGLGQGVVQGSFGHHFGARSAVVRGSFEHFRKIVRITFRCFFERRFEKKKATLI